MKLKLKYILLSEIVISFLLSIVIINQLFREQRNFENLALGIYTTSYFGQVNNVPIQTMGLRDEDKIVSGVKNRSLKKVVLMVGNSQTHSINQFKNGNVTFPELIADSLNKKSIDIITSSIPNATFEDFYLLYKQWKENIKINILFVPVFLDDTREEGIQKPFYADVKMVEMKDSDTVTQRIKEQLKELAISDVSSVANKKTSLQDQCENFFDSYLDKHFTTWHLRPNVRGDIFNNLYKLRNTVFNIDAKTKRTIIKSGYDRNMMALKALLNDCKKDGIKVVVYIPPLRNDYEIPYILEEYNKFKTDIASLCNEYNAIYRNYESIVPNQYWGVKGTRTFKGLSDIDFMHFQYPGHIIMANTLKKEIENLVLQ